MTPEERLRGLSALARTTPQAVPVPSPCVSVCRMDDASGLCLGCWRTIDEIVAWGRLGDAARRQVWQDIRRRAGLQAQEQGAHP